MADTLELPAELDFTVEQPISTDLGITDDIFVKAHVIPKAGTLVPQHSHDYDHLTAISYGCMRVWEDGVLQGDFSAPAVRVIKAHTKHTFLALKDGTAFCCIHNVRRSDGAAPVEHEHQLPGAPVQPRIEDGVSIQEEPLDDFLRDAVGLFEEHCLAIGEPKDEWTRKNMPVVRRIAERNAWQIMTARCNGRMLGYLASFTSPSLEREDLTTATQTIFFVSKDASRLSLAMRLQRAAIEGLRARGVDEVYMRAGVRGSGPRLGALYRRLGAESFGELYKLNLKAA